MFARIKSKGGGIRNVYNTTFSTWRCSMIGSTAPYSSSQGDSHKKPPPSNSGEKNQFRPASRHSPSRSILSPRFSSEASKASKATLDRAGSKHLSQMFQKESMKKIAAMRRDTRQVMHKLQEVRRDLVDNLRAFRDFEKEMTRMIARYKRYSWIFGLVMGFIGWYLTQRFWSRRKEARTHSIEFLHLAQLPEAVRIARSNFFMEGRVGLSSNAYCELIDKQNLFVYNNAVFSPEMDSWLPDSLKHIHIVVPNALHNYFLKHMVHSFHETYPAAQIHVYLRDGAVFQNALHEWNNVTLPTTEDTTTAGNTESPAVPPEFNLIRSVEDYPQIIRDHFEIYPIQGIPDLDETFFVNRTNRMLLTCDLLAHVTKNTFPRNKLFFSTLYWTYALKGFTNKITPFPPKAYKSMESNMDLNALRKSLDQITFLPQIKGIMMAHGEPILLSDPSDESHDMSDELIRWRSSWQERSPELVASFDQQATSTA